MKKRKPAKKTTPTTEYDSQRETRVLLEEMNKSIKTIAEQHGSVVDRLERIDEKLEGDEALKFKLEMGIETLKSRVGTIDTKVTRMEDELKSAKMAVLENGKDIKSLETGQQEIKHKLDTVTTDHEQRIRKLETVQQ